MTLNILFAGHPDDWPIYREELGNLFYNVEMDVHLHDDPSDPQAVDYIIYAPNGPVRDFTPFTRARAVLNLWAGVEDVVNNPTLRIPLVRMVDPGLSRGMTEWVCGHVLRHHLGMDRHILNQNGTWLDGAPPLACDRGVTLLGLGALGRAAAEALVQLGFMVTGWSRSQKDLPGVTCLSGERGLAQALSYADILVLLLPLTDRTDSLLNAERIAQLPSGAVVINPGRGALIDDAALLAALDSGHLSHATLDVFRQEPLPPENRYWSHPRVTVTPHIASATRPYSASLKVVSNIARMNAGNPPEDLVDRARGY
ncbi:2-hydroxyacid dehydrogenase [Brevirhabdus sp.]|uniref:2-hydroxyacid dehydrogenase n=1 Tax=Brevirhabdus sp. TaxID=2004514 RepID=UPI004059ABBD